MFTFNEMHAAAVYCCVVCVSGDVIMVWCQMFDGEQNDDTSRYTQLFVAPLHTPTITRAGLYHQTIVSLTQSWYYVAPLNIVW